MLVFFISMNSAFGRETTGVGSANISSIMTSKRWATWAREYVQLKKNKTGRINNGRFITINQGSLIINVLMLFFLTT